MAGGEVIEVAQSRFDLISRFDEQPARLSPGDVVEQCKTKYGTLPYCPRPRDANDIDTQMTINEIIRAAEDESTSTCKECGEPGQQITFRGWIWALCHTHMRLRQQEAPAK